MKKSNFPYFGKKILVMGLGLLGGGVSAAAFFAKHGAKVKVTDLRRKRELGYSLYKLNKYPITYVLGKHREKDFLEADLIIKNPGVPYDNPFIVLALKNGKNVEMESSLFAKRCPCPIIAVTGTRGKSTTSAMIFEILKLWGERQVFLAGNLPDSTTLELLDKINKNHIVVMELSSWQLAGFHKDRTSPHIAVLTNFYPDHLNRYKNMEEYLYDKKAIYLYQKAGDILVLNKNDRSVLQLGKEAKGKVVYFDKNKLPKDVHLQILGQHNLSNAAAAFKTTESLGVPYNTIIEGLNSFKGLPDRLEKVRIVNKITFINDTTSTTPVALLAGVQTFKDKNIILLLGGNDKKLPMGKLYEAVKMPRVKKIILLPGSGTDRIWPVLNSSLVIKNKIAGRFDDFNKAVQKAYSLAEAGWTVLFSPGFTSFAGFYNEFDRGKQFKKIVKSL